ncbi:hypothetical protein [Noviherbaspirillum massiliense]|uniref:hypothetical protein n=1 Tax=Noviherbaspirillum massiliense TaxID=1465823 RepID=UPI0002FD4710|nr:hypothetical protein [Noviherbaspirillum massiliense]
MRTSSTALAGCTICLLAALAGCSKDEGGSPGSKSAQTHFPGMVTAGGGTSGEVMAQAKQTTVQGNPSGTPGIPEGAQGNPSGAAMGGTTQGAAASKTEPGGASSQSTPPSGTPQSQVGGGSVTTPNTPASPAKP